MDDADAEIIDKRLARKIIRKENLRPVVVPEIPSRMTVVERIYHQLKDEQPTSVRRTFTVKLESDEDPFSRKMAVGTEWKVLDLGYVQDVGILYLVNLDNETDILVRCGKSGEPMVLEPQESIRFRARDPKAVFVKADSDVKLMLYVYPA